MDFTLSNNQIYTNPLIVTSDMLQQITCRQTLHLITQLVDALAYIHSKYIVHCDLVPANILVNLSSFELIITNFGKSKQLEQNDQITLAFDIYGLALCISNILHVHNHQNITYLLNPLLRMCMQDDLYQRPTIEQCREALHVISTYDDEFLEQKQQIGLNIN